MDNSNKLGGGGGGRGLVELHFLFLTLFSFGRSKFCNPMQYRGRLCLTKCDHSLYSSVSDFRTFFFLQQVLFM